MNAITSPKRKRRASPGSWNRGAPQGSAQDTCDPWPLSLAPLGRAGERKQCHVAGPLDRHGEGALVLGAGAHLAPRFDFAALTDMAAEPGKILVIDVLDVVDGELGDLAPRRVASTAARAARTRTAGSSAIAAAFATFALSLRSAESRTRWSAIAVRAGAAISRSWVVLSVMFSVPCGTWVPRTARHPSSCCRRCTCSAGCWHHCYTRRRNHHPDCSHRDCHPGAPWPPSPSRRSPPPTNWKSVMVTSIDVRVWPSLPENSRGSSRPSTYRERPLAT